MCMIFIGGQACEGKVGAEKAYGEPLDGERRGRTKEYWLKSVLDCSVILRSLAGSMECPLLKLPVRGWASVTNFTVLNH